MEFNFLIKVIEQNVDFQNTQGVGVGLEGDYFCAALQLAKIKRVIADIGAYIHKYAALEMVADKFQFGSFKKFAGVQISLDIIALVLNEKISRNIGFARPCNGGDGGIEKTANGQT